MRRENSETAEGGARSAGIELSVVDCDPKTAGIQFERNVAAMIGDHRTVLAIGRIRPAFQTLLEQQGCRIAAPPEGMNEEFYPVYDVVLALELFSDEGALKSTLDSARSQLREGGFLVAAFQNAMHGSRRISMLLGREPEVVFPRPLAIENAALLLAKHQFAVGCVEREFASVIAPIDADRTLVTDEVLKRLNADVDATTVHYIIVAHPAPWPGMNWLHRRVTEQSGQIARAEKGRREANEQMEALHARLSELILLQEDARRAERDLRQQLLAAHQRLESRDQEVRDAYSQAARANQKLASMHASIPGMIGKWVDSLRSRFHRC